jgi:hypothetical protein
MTIKHIIRDISELSDREKLDLEYYKIQAESQLFMSKRAIKIREHFQNKPFSIDIKIGEIKPNEKSGKVERLNVFTNITTYKN